MINTHWGGVVEDNSFGTHEFLRLCELINAEPYICGNVGSGTVQEMQEWVEYITFEGESPMSNLRKANGREKPWKLTYFGVGNETLPRIHASASMNAQGLLHLSLCNLDPVRSADLTADIRGMEVKSVTGKCLAASVMQAHNTFDEPDAVHPVPFTDASVSNGILTAFLPPMSVTVLALS